MGLSPTSISIYSIYWVIMSANLSNSYSVLLIYNFFTDYSTTNNWLITTLIYNVVMIHNKGLNKKLMIVSWITIFSDQDFKNSTLINNFKINKHKVETFMTVSIYVLIVAVL